MGLPTGISLRHQLQGVGTGRRLAVRHRPSSCLGSVGSSGHSCAEIRVLACPIAEAGTCTATLESLSSSEGAAHNGGIITESGLA